MTSLRCSGIFILSSMILVSFQGVDGQINRSREAVYSTPAPRFQQTEDNYTYHKGERAILYCSVKHLGTRTVSWRKANETYFLTIGMLSMTADKRFSVAHIEDSADWNLMISNLTTADSGAYECQISSVDRDLRKEVFLNVKDEYSYAEPHIAITGNTHPDRGTEMALTCNASGAITPPDSIDWFKDGLKIIPDRIKQIEMRKKLSINSRTITSILTKASAEMSDTGIYSCRASDLQVVSVRVNVLNTDKRSKKREPEDGQSSYTMDSSDSSAVQTHSSFQSYMLYLFVIFAFN